MTKGFNHLSVWVSVYLLAYIDAVTGDLADYAKGVSGIKYAYTAELRGTCFNITADQIPLSYQEVYNGIVALVKATQS